MIYIPAHSVYGTGGVATRHPAVVCLQAACTAQVSRNFFARLYPQWKIHSPAPVAKGCGANRCCGPISPTVCYVSPSLRFPKTLPMTPVKAASAKLCCICLAGFGLPGSLTVIRKPRVWQPARRGARCVWVCRNTMCALEPWAGSPPSCRRENGLPCRQLFNGSCLM